MKSILFALALLLPTAFAGGELFMRTDYNQQHVLGAYPPGTSNLNAIPRQHMGALDMPYAPEPPQNVTRVLFVGDSYTWGGAVHPSQRFADVFARAHPGVEVVVLAPKGANTPMEFDLWKEYGRDVNANAVVLVVSSEDNDMGFIPQPAAPNADYLRYLMPNSHLAVLVDDRLQRDLTPAEWFPWFDGINTDPQTLETWDSILSDFAADIAAHGAKPYALILAQPTVYGEDYTRRTYARMEAHVRGAGFETVNLLPHFEAHYGDVLNKRERWASPNDSHYNAETHALIAGVLGEMLEAEIGTESR